MPTIIVPADITNVASEFATETTQRLEAYIGLAQSFISECAYGSKYKNAVIFMACHLLKLDKIGASGTGGTITSEKVGDLQTNYGNVGSGVGGKDADLAQTPYGLMLIRLNKGILKTPLVV